MTIKRMKIIPATEDIANYSKERMGFRSAAGCNRCTSYSLSSKQCQYNPIFPFPVEDGYICDKYVKQF